MTLKPNQFMARPTIGSICVKFQQFTSYRVYKIVQNLQNFMADSQTHKETDRQKDR